MSIKTLAGGLLLALLAAGCARAEAPQPLLWKVSDADNSLYLLGSFHLLRPADYPLDPRTDLAFEDAERVVFELSPEDMAGTAVGQLMLQAATRADGRRLQDTLPPATWASLEAWGGRRGIDVARLQDFEAWYVSLLVSLTEMRQQGLDPTLGLDRHFGRRATEAGKPAEGLETGAQQIELFDGMDEAQQVQALEEALQSPEELERNVRELHALWRAGDGAGLYAGTAARMREQYPALYERVNVQRNRAWLHRLKGLLDEGGHDEDALVVVGALHLLGDEGVVELLRAEGYTVERL
ncbi:TraB/GumN family protein [Arenimonas caeni]|uniref:TraB/GumN family protein n=1 Tax=Arenimonas caeni TaxID=2058085 RepID=A0A2P6M738_9GAMM|nr:TraB/GumN family protein [Arenimonas caeni]PRH81790.1 hypothetical protein C6N40_10370 [Arenimonas caeni]